MSKYRVETSHGTFEVEADREPTLADVEAALAQQSSQPEAAKEDTGPGKVENVLGNPYFPKVNDRAIMSKGNPGENIAGFTKHVADTAMEGGGATVGQMAGAPFAPVTFGASIPVGGAIGGGIGNVATQMRKIHSGEREVFSLGELGGAIVTGAIPGGSQIKTAGGLLKEGAKNVIGNYTAEAVRTGIDEHRMPNAMEGGIAAVGGLAGTALAKGLDIGKAGRAIAGQMEADSVENALIKSARDAGYVLPPSKINPNVANGAMDYLAGDSAVGKSFSLKNQVTTDKLARQYLGLPENTALSEANIKKTVFDAQLPYREIAALSPKAAGDLDGFMQSRADSRRFWKAYDNNPTPQFKDLALQSDEMADLFEQELKNEAQAMGNVGLMKRFDEARVKLAKINAIDQALGSDGHVSAKVLSRARENGMMLTDDALTIAKTYETFKPVMRDRRDIGAVGSGKIPIVDKIARGAMATDTYQDRMAVPTYGDARPDAAADFGRLSTMLFTQEDPETAQSRQNRSAMQYLSANKPR